MYSARINNEINLTYPDSFAEMGPEELTKYFGSPENRWGVYDAADHIILSVSWTKLKFPKTIADAESAMIGIESRLSRRLLNYQKVTSYKYKLAGKKKAYGIRFEYRVNDAALVQVGDVVAFKNKNMLYTIYFITRKKNAASSRMQLQETLNSITAG